MKKLVIFIFTVVSFIPILATELPHPKNNQLYTEYSCSRYTTYLKNPQLSTGIIVLDGEDQFLFQQNQPVQFKVLKNADTIFYQHGNRPAIAIDGEGSTNNELMVLFDPSADIQSKYNVTKVKKNNLDHYHIIPKTKSNIKRMVMLANEDIVITLEIYFTDKSKLIYQFTNTITGEKPDAKYFQ
ncbi:MAG: outer-membrane lipoprotein carrier protein LolA [Spirochaetes bacterium]|nr:outer-membrane lipoprotein carrier protein LolA [Spirochaetota bacterium]